MFRFTHEDRRLARQRPREAQHVDVSARAQIWKFAPAQCRCHRSIVQTIVSVWHYHVITITRIVHALTASLFVNCLMTISETSLGRNEPSRSVVVGTGEQ